MKSGALGLLVGVLVFVACFTGIAACEEQPMHVTVCQLKSNPPAFNHKLIEVTGFVSHAFEDFSLSDPMCPSYPSIWLEYGGKAKSGTMYCCGVAADRHRAKDLKIEDIPVSLTENEMFRQFDRLVQPPFKSGRHGAIVRATLVGRFFSGELTTAPGGTFWGGYGHLGCCSLLGIQEVKSVDGQDREDLDYGASMDQPPIDKPGCGFRFLEPIQPTGDLIRAQEKADANPHNWTFDDPERVASNALAHYSKVDESLIVGLKRIRKAQGRHVYEWTPPGKVETYLVVISRPYLLSFYARDPKRVPWVVTAAYLSSCEEN